MKNILHNRQKYGWVHIILHAKYDNISSLWKYESIRKIHDEFGKEILVKATLIVNLFR